MSGTSRGHAQLIPDNVGLVGVQLRRMGSLVREATDVQHARAPIVSPVGDVAGQPADAFGGHGHWRNRRRPVWGVRGKRVTRTLTPGARSMATPGCQC